MEDYITVEELCRRTKYSRQSIYNMINKNIFKLNQHYYKPTPKKILFIWSAIEIWLAGECGQTLNPTENIVNNEQIQQEQCPTSKINI